MELCICGIEGSSKHFGQCKQHRESLKLKECNITEEYLITEYIDNGKSIKVITKELGFKNPRNVLKKLKEYNIPIRTLQEAKKQKHHIELAKQTSLERYGVEFHFQKDSQFIEIRDKTCLNKYGVKNVFQSEIIKETIKETCLERYGVENVMQKNSSVRIKMQDDYFNKTGYINPWENPEIIKKCGDTKNLNLYYNPPYSEKSQILFYKIYEQLPKELQEHTYFAKLNKEYGKYDNINKRYYYYDFVITNIKYCLEYNGTYYHAKPDKYNEDFYNKHTKCTAKEMWNKDKIKQNLLINMGFTVDIVWEDTETDVVVNNIILNCKNMFNI